MGMIFEIIFDLIVEGSIDAVSDKKAPTFLRVAAIVLLVVVYAGLIGFCLYLGIHDKSWIAAAIGFLIIVFTIEMVKVIIKKRKQKE